MDNSNSRRLRVFLSYSHAEKHLASAIAEILRDNGIDTLYDENLQAGDGFHEEIKNFIDHAHIFLPVLTPSSASHKWVQQEIGYAVAMRVPVVPVALDCDPGAFLHGIEAIKLRAEDPDVLRTRLTEPLLKQRVKKAGTPALYEAAETTEDRAKLFTRYCSAVSNLGRSGEVRQSGALSSFHIPEETPQHEVWRLRYGNHPHSDDHNRALWGERMALGEHAAEEGYSIIVDPDIDYSYWGGKARLTRLHSLLKFLAAEGKEKRWVAIAADNKESVTIVGDWFAAQSVAGEIGRGYRQTIFTRHAPTIKKMIDHFDRRFHEALNGTDPSTSRQRAIEVIQAKIAQLESAN